MGTIYLFDIINYICRYIRSEQLGQGTARRPEIIDNIGKYKRVVGGKIGQLVREGPDRRPTAYTPWVLCGLGSQV